MDDTTNDNETDALGANWYDTLTTSSPEERRQLFNEQLQEVAGTVLDMHSTYDHYVRHQIEEYQGTDKRLFDDIFSALDIARDLYNHCIVDICLTRAFTALRHIELLYDLSVYQPELSVYNNDDAWITLNSVISFHDRAASAFKAAVGATEWQADSDIEFVERMAEKSDILELLKGEMIEHMSHALSQQPQPKHVIKFRTKEDFVDELNVNTYFYAAFAVEHMKVRADYAKALFNELAKNPKAWPSIEAQGFPHADIFLNETILKMRAQLMQIPKFIESSLANNEAFLSPRPELAMRRFEQTSMRALPLFYLDNGP